MESSFFNVSGLDQWGAAHYDTAERFGLGENTKHQL